MTDLNRYLALVVVALNPAGVVTPTEASPMVEAIMPPATATGAEQTQTPEGSPSS